MKQLIRNICNSLKSGKDLFLASIVKSSGSTPRSSGSKMVIRRDGSIDGTIGGGLLEAMVQQEAAKLFQGEGSIAIIKEFDLSNELAANADMICGGHVSVMLEHLPADEATLSVFTSVDKAMRMGKHAVLFTVTGENRVVERQAVRPCCQLPALDSADAETASRMQEETIKSGLPVMEECGNVLLMAEAFIPQPELFIFGAGHVSRPTAALASSVNFRTVVLDDRSEFANRERFPEADEIRVLAGFENCFAGLDVNVNSYVIIVTRGHLHDKTVLGQALATPARYVGMIGSRKKRDAIYEALLSEGLTQNDIDRCHCPIGLSIGAQTPEEIAVSIVAELIQKRAG
ncbi:XdhC family aldehyde oxidoreductase maturation factor [Maridesulfovibrio sp. FT414]|uniref:XdhC family aldehyde oxidoreductase maturation factor n=1 Tax=Maridesulfovibrio sp. FT414 TaxID=2979469 RepID=UPI003D80A283